MKRKLCNACTIALCFWMGVLLFGLMTWLVYEANDLSNALIVGGAVLAMVLREAYHQSWPAGRRRR